MTPSEVEELLGREPRTQTEHERQRAARRDAELQQAADLVRRVEERVRAEYAPLVEAAGAVLAAVSIGEGGSWERGHRGVWMRGTADHAGLFLKIQAALAAITKTEVNHG